MFITREFLYNILIKYKDKLKAGKIADLIYQLYEDQINKRGTVGPQFIECLKRCGYTCQQILNEYYIQWQDDVNDHVEVVEHLFDGVWDSDSAIIYGYNINDNAFANNKNLKHVNTEQLDGKIHRFAFFNCSIEGTVDLRNIEYIDEYAFAKNNIDNIILSSYSLQHIAYDAFIENKKLIVNVADCYNDFFQSVDMYEDDFIQGIFEPKTKVIFKDKVILTK